MSSTRAITVLATSVGNDGFPSTLEALKDNGEREVRVVGTDVRPTAVGLQLSDAGHLVPRRAEGERFIGELQRIAAQEGADVILPLSTEDQPFFAAHAERFDVPVVVSTPAAVAVANDKLALLTACRDAGIPVPRYAAVHTFADIERAIPELGWPDAPFVFKTNTGTGASGVKVVDPALTALDRFFDRDNLRIRFDDLRTGLAGQPELPPSHVVEYLPGAEYSVDVLSASGRPRSIVVRERHAALYGLATHATVVDRPAVAEVAAAITAAVGLDYVSNLQFRDDARGEPRLLEINPRLPGTIGLTVAAGVNLPYLAVKAALGEPFTAPEPVIGTEALRTWRLLTRRA